MCASVEHALMLVHVHGSRVCVYMRVCESVHVRVVCVV